MPTVKYLGTEIQVSPGTSRSGETAFICDESGLRCFLGGLAEAKRFLRERKAGPTYGPRAASYWIRLDGTRGASASYSSHAVALSDFEYFARDGRTVTLIRVEHCAYPGCDGRGEVQEPSRKRGFHGYVTRPCPHHEAPIETVEAHCEPARRTDRPLPHGPGGPLAFDDPHNAPMSDACDLTSDL